LVDEDDDITIDVDNDPITVRYDDYYTEYMDTGTFVYTITATADGGAEGSVTG
jgi:hypothetical protein